MTVRKQLGRLAVLGALALGLTPWLVANSAAAQDPELGDTGTGTGGQWQGGQQPQGGQWGQQGQQPPQGGQWGQQGGQQPPPAGGGQWQGGQQPAGGQWGAGGAADTEHPTTPATPAAADGATDHSRVVHHVGVGWAGLDSLPFQVFDSSGSPIAGTPNGIAAPTIGIRYWISDLLGLDVTLGIGLLQRTVANDTTSVDTLSAFGFGLHGALPLAIYSGQHYSFLIIPELTFAYASGSVPSAASADNRDNYTGFLFGIGARAGAELNFGFIDVPELALEGTVGLGLSYQSLGADVCTAGDCSTSAQGTINSLDLTTSVQNEPWDIFTGAIRARYYF